MSTTSTVPTTTGPRLLAPRAETPTSPVRVPVLPTGTLIDLVERSGLTGRGGAGFPTHLKLRDVLDAATTARRAPIVVGNAMEGEPLSRKDAVLLARSPQLVLEGLALVGSALGATDRLLALGPTVHAPGIEALAHPLGIHVRRLTGGFVAGQESALVDRLAGQQGVPRDPVVRITRRGLDRRPTLVLNVETLAQLSLVVRHGPEWFRTAGTAEDPGTSLFTVTGAVADAGVVEAPRGTRICDVLAASRPDEARAVLVGGFHGAWVPAQELTLRLTAEDLGAHGAAVGAGVLHVLDDVTCPLSVAADIAGYLAGESVGQCGPCVNGLPRMADSLRRLAGLSPDASLPAEIDRLRRLTTGRGACRHPDGTGRMIASTMTTFADHVEAHLAGRCPRTRGGLS